MSKKLLKESTVRRFMTLASIDGLSEEFVNERYGSKEDEYKRRDVGGVEKKAGDIGGHYKDYEMNEASEEDELEATEDELGAEDEIADEEAGEIDDLEGDMEMDAEGGDVTEDDVVDIVATIADALEDKYGIAVDVEGGADDMGDEMEMDVEDETEVEMDAEGGDEEMDVEMVDDEEIVAEVLKRVTARLKSAIRENKKTKITRK